MKIICVGRNYAKHAEELKNEVPSDPVIFMKPETSIVPKRNPFFIPDFSDDVHYEAELVVRINKVGKHIEEKFAHKYYDEITLGLDFTARDLQSKLKEKGLPWEKAKAFDGSAAVGKFVNKKDLPPINDLKFQLHINDKLVQDGHSADMLFQTDRLIAYVSQFFTLKIGDLIFTGTPSGVGRVHIDDRLKLTLEGQQLLTINVK